MSQPFLGEIRMFAGTYAPRQWAFCAGTLLAISSYDALYSLLGTTYGGDGRSSFALPDLRGRIPVHQGQGPGLTGRTMGSRYGQEEVTLSTNEIPLHNHPMQGSNNPSNSTTPAGRVVANISPDKTYVSAIADPTKLKTFKEEATADNGGGQPHENRMPYMALNYIICIQGLYPSRN